MGTRFWLFSAVLLTVALVLLLVQAPTADARPGGGHSYSGGSHSGSSHSSGGGYRGSSGSTRGGGGGGPASVAGFAAVFVLFIVVLAILVLASRSVARNVGWDSVAKPAAAGRMSATVADFDSIRALDRDFSAVLFEDFAYALFARVHRSRHDAAELAALAPYVDERTRGRLSQREPLGAAVVATVVGAMRPLSVWCSRDEAKVNLEFEANLTMAAAGAELTQYLRERWILARPASARTRPWKGVRTFGCPACGAPLESGSSNVCASCGQRVDDGRFDWTVRWIEVEKLENRPPALAGTVEERGTDLPTVFQPGWQQKFDSLLADDPGLSSLALEARLRLIYGELQRAWATQDLASVRPYVSIGLYQYLDYWVNAYRRHGLRNLVDEAVMERLRVVRVIRDAHYDSLTFRMWATGYDYTLDAKTGEAVGGSREQKRPYTEYWTIIRGSQVRGAPRTEHSCPSCGAELKVNMQGNCEYCGGLLTSGDFDWVLSKIEQDDSYMG